MPKLDGMALWNLFCESKSRVRTEKFPREVGMLPKRLLSDRIRVSSCEEICTSGGTNPTKLLPPRPKSSIDELLKRAEGISPLRWFFVRSRNSSDELFARKAGMPLVSVLLATSRAERLESVPSPSGMLPCSLLMLRMISCRCEVLLLTRLEGISPSRRLLERSMNRRREQEDRVLGIMPMRLLYLRFK
jgi:hypothetical protein